MKLTGFADEISPDLHEQIATLQAEGIRWLELRSVWGKNVTVLERAELLAVKDELDRHGIAVSAIASRVGKKSVREPIETQLHDLDRAMEAAELFGTRYIRLFAFLIPEGERPEAQRDEVMRRMAELLRRVQGKPFTLLLEHEAGMFADNPQRCLDVMRICASPQLRMVYDPANFVQIGVPAMPGYELLAPYIDYIHVKDARFADGQETPPGDGDAELEALFARLKAAGYDGFVSLEPHLRNKPAYAGTPNPALFRLASSAAKRLLEHAGCAWS